MRELLAEPGSYGVGRTGLSLRRYTSRLPGATEETGASSTSLRSHLRSVGISSGGRALGLSSSGGLGLFDNGSLAAQASRTSAELLDHVEDPRFDESEFQREVRLCRKRSRGAVIGQGVCRELSGRVVHTETRDCTLGPHVPPGKFDNAIWYQGRLTGKARTSFLGYDFSGSVGTPFLHAAS